MENLKRGIDGTPVLAWAPSHEDRVHQMLMRVNIRCRICLQQAAVVNSLFFTDVFGHLVVYTTVPVAFRLPFLCIFTNLEVPCCRNAVPLHASRGTLTTGLPFPSPNSTLLPRSHSITVDRHAINCVRPARTRGPSSCDHQARPSASFVDDTIDLPWRNFPEYRVRDKVPEGSTLIFGDTRISLQHIGL